MSHVAGTNGRVSKVGAPDRREPGTGVQGLHGGSSGFACCLQSVTCIRLRRRGVLEPAQTADAAGTARSASENAAVPGVPETGVAQDFALSCA